MTRPRSASGSQTLSTTHVVARVGGERFAFGIQDVEAAFDAPCLTPVPLAVRGLAGELPYRGRTVRAFDASCLFGVGSPAGERTGLVFRDGDERLVLLVDDVEDLADVPFDDLRAIPPGTDGAGVLRGVCLAADGRLVALVQVDAMVALATAAARESGEEEP